MMTRTPARNLRGVALCSTLAIATSLVVGPNPAAAQSFQGTGTFTHGSGSINAPALGTTTDISITSSQAVIDWTPFDTNPGPGAIGFQFDGTTATFNGASSYAVLNRINPVDASRAIVMDGIINSLIGGEVTGGSIYFYSPGGIVLGANAAINVGSLVLSTSPIAVDGNGEFITGPDNTVTFGQAATDTHVWVNPGAQIDALNEGSYVALVAPEVWNGGTINVNGAAALVGAEAATINFRAGGLFDIQVTTGTTDINGVRNTGTITGPASSGPGDHHRAYLVAVPKNTALTMLIQSGANLGFDVAQAADVVGNAIILSAGHNVSFGSIEDQPVNAATQANAGIDPTNVTSALFARAENDLSLSPVGVAIYASDVSLRSGNLANVFAQFGNTLNILGDLTISSDRIAAEEGQTSIGGTSWLLAQTGGSIAIGGDLAMMANGYGGDSFTAGLAAGNGGGGSIVIQPSGGTITVAGNIQASANGYGGEPGVAGSNAGNGTGGSISIDGSSALDVQGTTFASASGYGGNGDGFSNECSNCDGLGGIGQGGSVSVGGNNASFGSFVDLYAEGEGGRSASPGTSSAAGFGGTVSVSAPAGTVTFGSDLRASAIGRGGESFTSGITAGQGDGGTITITANANATMGIGGDLDADASGYGGYNDLNVDGGDGIGGVVNLFALAGTGSISVTGATFLTANGEASFNDSDCTACGGAGGNGTGGSVRAAGSGITNIADSLFLSANGYGGIGVSGAAGNGSGGSASLGGLNVQIGGNVFVDAEGYGGYDFGGFGGGDGVGGFAGIDQSGGTKTIAGSAFLDASGYGGGSGQTAGGVGGDGTGGTAHITASSGTVEIAVSAFVEAVGEGGTSFGGVGGNGTGGSTSVGGAGGAIHILTNLVMDGGAIGGNGDIGGNATGLVTDPLDEESPSAAAVYVNNGGLVDVDGITIISATATGGDGANGNGGNASAGEADVVAYVGNILLGGLIVDADAFGGAGGNGGNGGFGQAGVIDLAFGFGAAAVGGTISMTSLGLSADGHGGDGGAGIFANFGGDGGAGGDGRGGHILAAGNAAGGMLDAGNSFISAAGYGGDGGAGGDGIDQLGGNGGAGGLGEGGYIQTGTVSAEVAPGTGGGANYTSLTADTSGVGGAGGNAGTGGGGTGDGGNGGNALGGQSMFLARGVLVTAGAVTLTANATGGDGGSGSVQGNGGNAATGFIAVESKDRFQHPDQRGTLTADSITGNAIAVGGLGAQNGTSTIIDGSYFRVLNGDATIGSVSINLAGDIVDTTNGPSFVSAIDGMATITGDFSFTTTGNLALFADNGSMTVGGTLTLSAGNFVPDTVNEPPANAGTYFANAISITTDNNIYTTAHLDSATGLNLVAPGSVTTGNLNGNSFDVAVNALGGSIDVGDINGADVTLDAFGTLSTGDIDGDVVLATANGNISTGDIFGFEITLDSFGGNVAAGDLFAFDGVFLDAGGNLSFGNIDAYVVNLNSGGAIDGGDIVSETDITAIAGTGIDLGDLTAGGSTSEGFSNGSVGLTAGAAINTGSISAFGDVSLNAGGSISTLDIDAQGFVDLFAGLDVTTGDIIAGNNLFADADSGTMALGDLDADDIELFADGAMTFGNVTAGTEFDFESNSTVTGGNITAGVFATGSAEGAVALGNISAGLGNPQVLPDDGFSVGMSSATSINVGDVTGAHGVGFATWGPLTAGDIDAAELFMALVGGDMDLGAITTDANGQVYLADASMFIAAGGGEDNFDAALVLALDPVATAGSITIGGPVSTGQFRAAAGADLNAGQITAQSIHGSAGGTATLSGIWSAGSVDLASNDINILSTGGIDGGLTGSVSLFSTNATQALIGDGLEGSGYALSNAEFGRIEGGSVYILARGDATAAQDMLIGDLTVTGPLAGSTIENSEGILVFATGDVDGETPSGVIQVVGNVNATGFGSDNAIEFYADRFELDAATGSIAITSTGGALAGELGLYADQIHVAEASILDQLAVDPQYAGYQEDLNAPAAVQRPAGVLNAATIWIESDNLQNILIQNTGTAETPAGFLAQDIFVNDDEEVAGPPGSIDVVVNGQLQTEAGTLTGIEVRDALVAGENLTPFTANSTINGCLLTGACDVVPPPPPEEPTLPFDPVGGISAEIILFSEDPLNEQPFGNEAVIDEDESSDWGEDVDNSMTDDDRPLAPDDEIEAEEDETSSPIEPPAPLFDTRPLNSDANVDEPISGSGNPALIGAGPTNSGDEQ